MHPCYACYPCRLSAWFLWATRSPAAAGSPLAEFAAHVLPRDSASCLRLIPTEEARCVAGGGVSGGVERGAVHSSPN